MVRRIIQIDQEKCNGCGLCAEACHEHAIGMVDGKATLLRDDYCDGLGDCLPACPMDAIHFVEREALDYDEAAVKANIQRLEEKKEAEESVVDCAAFAGKMQSELRMWPVQIKLAPINAPYFDGCSLLIASDCCAYAYGDFHRDFIKGRVTLIGCPKLDMVDYSEKLAMIFASNNIKDITFTRMTVPCCGGMERAIKTAIEESGKDIPLKIVTIHIDGTIQ
ncbi:MAG: 4Fe-4S binding protein [Eubacteriales bacterium]|nr:4Fe-4S binding protein [Eubacteriales bacterium]